MSFGEFIFPLTEWFRRTRVNLLWPEYEGREEIIELVETKRDPKVSDLKERLWKKDKDGKFIDIGDYPLSEEKLQEFANVLEALDEDCHGKDVEKAKETRRMGNRIDCPTTALKYYNESLRNAEYGSTDMALAYANRAACFYKMELNKLAFMEINRAKEAKFPTHLRAKLAILLADVIFRLNEESFLEIQLEHKKKPTELSFLANEDHPPLADVVTIKNDRTFGRHMLSKFPLRPNDVILVEEDYLRTVDHLESSFRACATCFEMDKNFIPCEKCREVVFCNEYCRERNHVHAWECNTFITTLEFEMKLPLHSMLKAFDTFTRNDKLDLNSLRNHVKLWLKTIDDLPSTTHDSRSKYEFFFKLSRATLCEELLSHKQKPHEMVYLIENMLLKIPKIAEAFQYRDDYYFLRHLIIHHCIVIKTNCFGDEHSTSLGLIQSLFNHSCDPNVFNRHEGAKHIYYLKKRVRRNAQLYISYVYLFHPTERRQEVLHEHWGFICACKRCVRRSGSKEVYQDANSILSVLSDRFSDEYDGEYSRSDE
ncbi:putative protein lysine methyltransferase SET5 [Contarinia nasturtii]|uniref:putative protein lysine methyltransferase SET5 n=1 Tax=Contarinia nasturtii TaxID=265458 RepID=UPI0012D3BF0F|nr:putative protein lysine methyltransferase SET5 [Contarinia nasturtii]